MTNRQGTPWQTSWDKWEGSAIEREQPVEEAECSLEHEPSIEKPDDKWYPNNIDWYVKWAASVLVLISLALRSAGPEYRIYDLWFGVVGIALWTWVSVMWKDRALIILNAVSFFFIATAILREM